MSTSTPALACSPGANSVTCASSPSGARPIVSERLMLQLFRQSLQSLAVALGSESGRCLSVADYVKGAGGPPGQRPPPQRANVSYALGPRPRVAQWANDRQKRNELRR